MRKKITLVRLTSSLFVYYIITNCCFKELKIKVTADIYSTEHRQSTEYRVQRQSTENRVQITEYIVQSTGTEYRDRVLRQSTE